MLENQTSLKLNRSLLDQMTSEIESSGDLYRPSPFCANLTRIATKQLEQDGLENFKRTVNMKYFNWNALTIVAHQLHPVLLHWFKNPCWDIFSSQFNVPNSKSVTYKTFNPVSAKIYQIYLCLLYNYVKSIDKLGLLDKITEPTVGNPYLVAYRGKMISQDLCNSIHEFYSATETFKENETPNHITELGAGYGRLAYVFLKALPNCTYTIVDIPVALYVAQEYLSKIFPQEKIFRFRHFDDYSSVKTEFESSRIRFVSANQSPLLPGKSTELFINVSSLHEMTVPQIKNYFNEIDRITKKSFYSKQWLRSIAKENGFVIRQGEYPIPKTWETVYDRKHPIQRLFFEASYRI
jgi:putative sugar O-methyltransferase